MSGHFHPETGELLDAPYVEPGIEELRRELDEVRGDLARTRIAKQDAVDLLLKAEREVKRLKTELEKQLAEVPERQVMKTIYQGWVAATGRNPKQSKFGPKRQGAVLARIREGHTFERMMRAATIGVKGANVSNKEAERLALIAVMKRAVDIVSPEQATELRQLYRSTLGKGPKVYDDLELIFRDEVNLERFADMADVIEPLDSGKSIDAAEREGA